MSWRSIADLIVDAGTAEVALVGAQIEAGSVTPGRCDLAPATIRRTLRRFSTYDAETGDELSLRLLDAGDADVILPTLIPRHEGGRGVTSASRPGSARR